MLSNFSTMQYALFDWDGTLADNKDTVIFSMEKVLEEYNLPNWEETKHLRDSKLSLWDNFNNIFADKSNDAYNRYLQIYKSKITSLTKPFPMASEIIDLFNNLGLEVMIMTNKDRRLLDIELPLLYNPNKFSRIVCGHEAPKDKPYPDHIYYTLRGKLSPIEINPQRVMVIGDSNQDSDCAISARALPVRVNNPIFGESNYHSSQIVHYKDFAEMYQDLAKY